MRELMKLAVVLLVLGAVAGGLLGLTNEITKGPIAANAAEEAQLALAATFPAAEAFEELTVSAAGIDACFAAKKADETLGYVARTTVTGFKGKIEVTVGMDLSGALTAIQAGGANFAETADLGEKVRGAEFTGQYEGKSPPLALGTDIDAISGATVSSQAVNEGVNLTSAFLKTLPGLEGN